MPTTPLMKISIYFVLIIAISLAGGILPLIAKWREGTIRLFVSFGAGVLLAAAFIHMIPASAQLLGSEMGIPLLIGFLSLYVFEKFVMVHACEAHDCHYHTLGWAAFLGLGLHSLTDGLVLGTSFVVPEITMAVFLAILLHKFPASFSLSSILILEKFSRKKIYALLAIFTLAVPIGGLITYFLLSDGSEKVIGWLVAFSAGTFLHVAADDLLPEVHSAKTNRLATLVTFFLGLCVIWLNHEIGHH